MIFANLKSPWMIKDLQSITDENTFLALAQSTVNNITQKALNDNFLLQLLM